MLLDPQGLGCDHLKGTSGIRCSSPALPAIPGRAAGADTVACLNPIQDQYQSEGTRDCKRDRRVPETLGYSILPPRARCAKRACRQFTRSFPECVFPILPQEHPLHGLPPTTGCPIDPLDRLIGLHNIDRRARAVILSRL